MIYFNEKGRMDQELFSFVLQRMIEEEASNIKNLLAPIKEGESWKAHPDFVREMQILVDTLSVRFIRRASLFGQYRSDPDMMKTKKRARPPPLECRESDFNLAWQTLEQDSI